MKFFFYKFSSYFRSKTAMQHFQFDINTKLMWIAVFIGILTALGAELLHWLVGIFLRFSEKCNLLLSEKLVASFSDSGNDLIYLLIFLLPLVGITLSYTLQYIMIFPKSLTPLILKLDQRNECLPFYECFSHIFSSALSVGFGGSAGLEAPSVLTGAAVGSNLAKFCGIEQLPRSLMVGCGSAAAIASIFTSPIAGVLFTVEVLMPEFTISGLIPMLLSSAVASVTSEIIRGGRHACFATHFQGWEINDLFPTLLASCLCALIGVFIIRSTAWTSRSLKRALPRSSSRLLCGGLLLCLCLAFFPHLRSQGYSQIQLLLTGNSEEMNGSLLLGRIAPRYLLPLLFLTAIFLKPLISSLTIESGGDGGIFAPTMFIGAFTGFICARIFNLSGLCTVSETDFAALGMCGVFTTVMRSPLTGIFLIAETTNGFSLLVPLMIISSVSWGIGKFFEPQSIYRKSLIADQLVSDDKILDHLKNISAKEILHPAAISFMKHTPMPEVFATLRKLKLTENLQNDNGIIPIIDDSDRLVGMLPLRNCFIAMLNESPQHPIFVEDFMDPPLGVLFDSDPLDKALANMERYHLKYLPVISADTQVFLGILSKDELFDAYRSRC